MKVLNDWLQIINSIRFGLLGECMQLKELGYQSTTTIKKRIILLKY